MPTLFEKIVGIGSMIVVIVVFRKELASELKMLKSDIEKFLAKRTTKKSP